MTISGAPILLVDDEPDVLEMLGMVLERAGYAVATAGDAAHALRLADETDFYLALVDYRLVGSPMDGLELIARLYDVNPRTVCLLITVYDKGAIGFRAAQAGAFDYLVKPFSNQALLADVRAALAERIRRERMRDRLRIGDLLVDVAARRVVIGTEEVSLSRQEFALLVYLANHTGRVVNYGELWKMVCRSDFQQRHSSSERLRQGPGFYEAWCVESLRKPVDNLCQQQAGFFALPCRCHSRLRLDAALSSHDLARWDRPPEPAPARPAPSPE